MSLARLRPSLFPGVLALALAGCPTDPPPQESDTDTDTDTDADSDADADADTDSDADTDADADTDPGCLDDALEPNDDSGIATPWPGGTTNGPYVLADEDWFTRPAAFVIADTFTVEYDLGGGDPTVELISDTNIVLDTAVGTNGQATVSAQWQGSDVYLRIVPPAPDSCITYSVTGG